MLSGGITALTSFNRADGDEPGGLIISGNTLYGETTLGGASDQGVIFSLPVGGGMPTVLASFNGTDGSGPVGGLVQQGTTLYGVTNGGGAHGDGEVFSLPTSGGTPTVLASIGVDSEAEPSSLILSGDTLYVTAEGIGGNGGVFSLPIAGGTPTLLAAFGDADGNAPQPGLVVSDNTLYGTDSGGYNDNGQVFSLPKSGGTPEVLGTFTYSSGGDRPGSLVLSQGTLFGTAIDEDGTPSDDSEVFSLPISGGVPMVVAQFARIAGAGAGNLIVSGDTLYGVATYGGANFAGEIFSVPEVGGDATLMASFENSDGTCPQDLIRSGNTLYGTTQTGGAGGDGTVFSLPVTAKVAGPLVTVDPTGESIEASDSASFTAYAAGDPAPTVQWYVEKAGSSKFKAIFDATSTTYDVHDATVSESGNEYEAVFRSREGSATTSRGELIVLPKVTDLVSFDGANGGSPYDLVISGSTLYGTAGGGAHGDGEVFSVPVTGGTPTVLESFDSGGSISLVSGGLLYGISGGGAHGDGAVFSLPLTGGTPTVLASFDGTDGSNSTGYGTYELVLSDGTLYGSTSAGGANGAGTFFSLPVTGGTPTVLASLGGSSGLVAVRSLIVSGGSLYAATVGAEQPSGEIVSLPITGGTPTVLAYLTRASGQYPGSLVLSGSTLFCSTTEEGPFGWGTIFSLPISGGTPAVLASSFGGGGEPQDLVLSNGTLYGATGAGTYIVFSLPVGGGTPTVLASLDGYPLAPGMVISGGTLYGTSSGFNDDGEVFSLPSLAASSISLTSSHVPVFQGKHVTLTATVSPAGGTSGTPTGTVTFYDGGHAIGIPQPIIDGTASFTDTTLPIGSDSITAIYSGDANFASAQTAAAIIARILPPPPTIVSTTASVSTHGCTIAASVVAADSGPGGAAGLTYTWTPLRMPSGAKMPTFNVNGTNAAQNIIARFSKAGDYILRCEVINASRYIELTDVFVTVSQKATALKIEPHAAHIAKGGTLQFTGTVLDQFNHPMRTAQTPTYLVAAGHGSISSAGLFSASSIAGPVTIELEVDDLTGTVGAVVG